MSLAVQISEAQPHRLSGALEGVGHELDLLRAHVLRMQDVFCSPETGVSLDVSTIRELQGLDLVSQRLDALSAFVGGVVDGLRFDPALDLNTALRGVPLSDLADRLGARSSGLPVCTVHHADADSGDFDLF